MANDDKARLYRQIVQQTDEYTLLERMRLHGFWPEGASIPQDPPPEAAERARVVKELADLRKQNALAKDPQARPASAQGESGVHRVSELVAKQPQPPAAVAALGVAGHPTLEAEEPRVCQKERQGDSRDAVRREPVGREPKVGPEADAAARELVADFPRVGVHGASGYAETEIAESQPQQCVVVEMLPVPARRRR